jgi:serine/threonine protein kinase
MNAEKCIEHGQFPVSIGAFPTFFAGTTLHRSMLPMPSLIKRGAQVRAHSMPTRCLWGKEAAGDKWIKLQQVGSTDEYSSFLVQKPKQARDEVNSTYVMKEMTLDMTKEVDWNLDTSFQQEVKAIRWLRGPGIPVYVESFEHQQHDMPTKVNQLILRLDASRGSTVHTMRALLDKGWRPTASQAADIASQLLHTLAHAYTYSPPYAHRAISPDCILIAASLPPGCRSAWLAGWGAPDADAATPSDPIPDLRDLGSALQAMLTQSNPAGLDGPTNPLGEAVEGLVAGRWPTADAALHVLSGPGLGEAGAVQSGWQGGSDNAASPGWLARCGSDLQTVLRRRADGGRLGVRVVRVGRGSEASESVSGHRPRRVTVSVPAMLLYSSRPGEAAISCMASLASLPVLLLGLWASGALLGLLRLSYELEQIVSVSSPRRSAPL